MLRYKLSHISSTWKINIVYNYSTFFYTIMIYWLFAIACIILPRAGLRICQKLGILENRKRADFYKRTPVPTAQWIPMWLTLIVGIVLLWRAHINSLSMTTYIIATTLLAIVATIDIIKPIPSRMRLLFQISLFTGIVWITGVGIDTIRLGGEDRNVRPRLSILWSVLRFIVCTNAVNRFDGIQGQAGGITAIGSLSIRTVVSFIVLPSYEHLTPLIRDQLEITTTIALVLGIVSTIYTIIEYKPLGLIRDIGTTIYGFSLAYLAVLGWAKVGTLVVTLSLVLFDWARVIAHRILILHKNPLKWDYTHLHHRLLANGWTRGEVRRFVRMRSLVMTILMIVQGTNSINKWIIFSMMAIIFFVINIYLFWIKKLPSEQKIDFTPQELEHH